MPEQYIEQLWDLVEFCHPQIAAGSRHTRVVSQCDALGSHVGAVFQHRRELVDVEILVLESDTLLQVKNFALARESQHDGRQKQDRRQHNDCGPGQKDINKSLD